MAADYYVAADENDSNPGMILQPFATIEEARLAVQSRIATWDDEGHYGHAARGNETWLSPLLAASVSNRPYDHADAQVRNLPNKDS